MKRETLLEEIEGGVAVFTLNRPDQRLYTGQQHHTIVVVTTFQGKCFGLCVHLGTLAEFSPYCTSRTLGLDCLICSNTPYRVTMLCHFEEI